MMEKPPNPTMEKPTTAAWILPISANDFSKLKSGLKPRNQDDKWRVFVSSSEPPNTTIKINRASFNIEFFVLHILEKQAPNDSSAEIVSLTWETSEEKGAMTEEWAKELVVRLLRANLECDFEAAPRY
ncbi:hypothetical protein GGI43DRAFT_213473 [Trichoderma evansii]